MTDEPIERPERKAQRAAQEALAAGGPFNPGALDSAARALALVRRVFAAAGGSSSARVKEGTSQSLMTPLRRALWAVEAAGALVALRRGPRGPGVGVPLRPGLVEVLEEAERVLDDASPESSDDGLAGSPPEVLEAVTEGALKALRLARRWAERFPSDSG